MKHLTALVIKFVFTAVITLLILTGMSGVNAGPALWVALILTLALYSVGDLTVLPVYGNVAASLSDAALALVLVWIAPFYAPMRAISFTSTLAAAALIGVAEYFFHGYVENRVLADTVSDAGLS